ncbi:MAG: UPF0175 family protein [Saprospiraceae bacterium]
MALLISDQFIQISGKTEQELSLELAVFFYVEMQMSLGKCAEFAGISRFELQRELARRGHFLHISESDVLHDLETLEKLGV